MELHKYPRPANDTGIGIHWVVGYATASGLSRIREFWIPELKAMGVKWVKIFNHDGALDFCELLLAEGIMPVVRIYRPSPNPGRLGVKELVHIDALVRAGVRYFEFNNEPDVDAEWKGGRVPVNGLDLTVDNTIANLEIVLERGGMPAVPAVANGSRWDLVGRIVAAGRKDLFDGPVWQAVHNYSRNRPLDYPYDIGNQEGAAYTDRFFRVLAGESWGEDAWRGRSLSEVNRLRYDRRSPGATIMDDHACFLAYEYFDALNRKHLGRSIPVLSTECGYLVGEDVDPRYPATSPDMHMAQTLEACRIVMGTSQRFKLAPDYYFCTAFWLLANQELGSTSTWWESHAWYSERWPTGVLPIVRALQAEPKTSRLHQPTAPQVITLTGLIANAGERRTVELERDDTVVARQTLDAASRFTFADLDPGRYVLRLQNTPLVQAVELTVGQSEVMLNLEVPAEEESSGRSVVAGRVRGGAGAVVMLVRKRDAEEWVTMARDDGSFRFVDLPPGVYKAYVYPNGTAVDDIRLDGRNSTEIQLAVTGWGYTIRIAEDAQRVGAIVVSTLGHKGLRVQAHAAEWSSPIALTGSAVENGQFAAVIAPLDADHYIVTVDGAADEAGKPAQLEARVQVDKRSIPLVEFVFTEPEAAAPPQQAAVRGRVIGQLAGQPVQAVLIDEQGGRTTAFVDDEGVFVFPNLPAGRFSVTLAGLEDRVQQADVVLDGRNPVAVELALPAPVEQPAPVDGQGVVEGYVPDGAGAFVRLIDAVGNERRTHADAVGRFTFDKLPAGVYALVVEGGYQQPALTLDGSSHVEITFAPVISVWETSVTNAGSMPGFSSVRVEVEGMVNLPVRIWQGEEEGHVQRTIAAPVGNVGAVEFRPLGPGRYMVEPEGLGIWQEIELSGLEAMWVSFRRKTEPVGENTIRTAPVSAAPAPGRPMRPPTTYVYLCEPPRRKEDLLALMQYTSKYKPQVGCDVEEAAQADRVLLVDAGGGSAGGDLAEVETQLLLLGVTVERITGDWSAFFRKLGS